MLVLHISEIKSLFHKLPSPDSQVINPLVCTALKNLHFIKYWRKTFYFKACSVDNRGETNEQPKKPVESSVSLILHGYL